jgi:hypothetical protein
MASEKGNTQKGAGSRDTVKSTRQDDVVWKHLDRMAVFISFLGDGDDAVVPGEVAPRRQYDSELHALTSFSFCRARPRRQFTKAVSTY